MNIYRHFAFFVLLSIYGCNHRSAAPPIGVRLRPNDDFIDAIIKMKRSVAPVVCATQASPDGPWSLMSVAGTAFFTQEDGSFVTANHVIEEISNRQRAKQCPLPSIYIPVGGWQAKNTFDVKFLGFAVETCFRDSTADLALCRPMINFRNFTGASAANISLNGLLQNDGVQIAFTGFPLNVVSPLTALGHIATYTDFDVLDIPSVIIVDRTAWPGASGSPVYLPDGRVIGIVVQRGTGNAEGMAFVRTTAALQKFLAAALKSQKNE